MRGFARGSAPADSFGAGNPHRSVDGPPRHRAMAIRDHNGLPLLHGAVDPRSRPPRRLFSNQVVSHRRRALPAHDQVLGKDLPHQLHHGRGHRPGAGIPVRHGLERIQPLRGGCLWRAPRHGSTARLLRGIDLPRALDLRLGPVTEKSPSRGHLGRRDRLDRVGLFHHRRQFVDAASGRHRAGRWPPAHERRLGGLHQQHRAYRLPACHRRIVHGRRSAADRDQLVPPLATSRGWGRHHRPERQGGSGRLDEDPRTRQDRSRCLAELPAHRRSHRAAGRYCRGHHRRPAGQAHVPAATAQNGLGRGRLRLRHRALAADHRQPGLE